MGSSLGKEAEDSVVKSKTLIEKAADTEPAASMTGKVKVHVLYCGAWGYKRKFQKLEKDLELLFPDALEFEGEKTKGRTGWLEITVNGQLIHSKKDGDGYVDSPEKMEKITAAIKKALKKVEDGSGEP